MIVMGMNNNIREREQVRERERDTNTATALKKGKKCVTYSVHVHTCFTKFIIALMEGLLFLPNPLSSSHSIFLLSLD